jgi:2,3-bisphosphoglycerate-independent phosphoglycerate mutase
MPKKPHVILIRDGWGFSADKQNNAIAACNPINHNTYIEKYPTALIHTSGEYVGLPKGNQGSSEVGHLNLGAGRIVYQNLVRISKAVKENRLKENAAVSACIKHVKTFNSAVHLYGLVQDQGVHAHTDHLIGYLSVLKNAGVQTACVHVISDGRDTPPKSAAAYVKPLHQWMDDHQFGRIASVTGRYFAMDRDNRWDRVQLFYDFLTKGVSDSRAFDDVYAAIEDAYEKDQTDEFIKPRKTKDFQTVKDTDAVIFFNYRFDRAAEISKAFTQDDFSAFETREIRQLFYLCTTEYYKDISHSQRADVQVAFPLEKLPNLMGKVIADNRLHQLRIAETEKFAHVTYFFNGQQADLFPNEDRILVPSPKVATYDMQPEMAAYAVTDKMLDALDAQKYDFIVLNYANPDMVGHTGDFDATVKACSVVDACVGKVVDRVLENDGVVLLTADHGNAETMVDPETGGIQTAHTSNKVWLSIISNRPGLQKTRICLPEDGKLADLSPTMLDIMGIKIPRDMTGNTMVGSGLRYCGY